MKIDSSPPSPSDPVPLPPPPFSSGNDRRWEIAIVLLALAVRLALAWGLQGYLDRLPGRQFLIEGDASGYWELAHKIVRGEPYAIYHPPRAVLRMPGFPALLAVSIWLFGDSLFAARIVLSLVATLAVWLTIRLGRTLVSPRCGLIAGGLAAVSPVLAGFGVEVLTETAFAATLLANLWALAAFVRRDPGAPAGLLRDAAWGLLIGGLIALACYMRPSWLLAAPAMSVALVILRAPRVRSLVPAAAILVGCGLALHPWAMRNQRLTGHYIPTTLWMGASLYDGLNPQATGDSEMSFFDRENLLGRMSEYEVDQEYRRRAWQFARENPGRTVWLAWEKLIRYWKPWPNAQQFDRWYLKLTVAGWFVPVLALALRGVWLRRRDAWLLLIAGGPVLYFCALHLLFVSSLRYRLPAEYPLLVLSAIGLLGAAGERRKPGPTA